MPDGISRAPDGSFWVAIFCPYNRFAGFVAPYKWIRWAISWLPEEITAKAMIIPLLRYRLFPCTCSALRLLAGQLLFCEGQNRYWWR